MKCVLNFLIIFGTSVEIPAIVQFWETCVFVAILSSVLNVNKCLKKACYKKKLNSIISKEKTLIPARFIHFLVFTVSNKQNKFHSIPICFIYNYDNTGCRVFKRDAQNCKVLLLKIKEFAYFHENCPYGIFVLQKMWAHNTRF